MTGDIYRRIIDDASAILDVKQSDDLCYLAIAYHSDALKYIKNQTWDMCEFSAQIHIESTKYAQHLTPTIMKLLRTNPKSFEMWGNKQSDICKQIAHEMPNAIKYIENASEVTYWYFLQENWRAIEFIPNPTKEMYEYLFEVRVDKLHLIPPKYQTAEMCKIAFEKDWRLFKMISPNYQTKEMCEFVFEKDPSLIYSINLKYRTPEMMEMAFEYDSINVGMLDNPSYDQWKKFVVDYPLMIEFVPKDVLTRELVSIAIENGCPLCKIPDEFAKDAAQFTWDTMFDFVTMYPAFIGDMKKPSNSICKAAIDSDFRAIGSLKHQKPHLCWYALQKCKDAIAYIANPTFEMEQFAQDCSYDVEYDFCEELMLKRVAMNSECIKYVNVITLKVFELVLNTNPGIIDGEIFVKFIKTNCENPNIWQVVMKFLEQHPTFVHYLHIQPEHICKQVVIIYPPALRYIRYQTPGICEIATNLDPSTNEYVRDERMRLFV